MKKVLIITIAVVFVIVAAAIAVASLENRTPSRPTPKDFTDYIPVTSAEDLAKIGSGDVYEGGRTWSLDEKYYLVNNIDFGTTDTNGGVNIGYTVTISGSNLTVAITIAGGGTASSLGAFIGSTTRLVTSTNTITLTGIPQPLGEYTLTICGRTGTTDFAYATLINTTVASHSGSFNSNGNFNPIGSEATPFIGVFDGNKMTISGMNVAFSATTTKFVSGGLFGFVKGASIIDTSLVNSSVTIAAPAGTQPAAAGGIVGRALLSAGQILTVSDCSFSGSITISLRGTHTTQIDSFAGGIVGYVREDGAGAMLTISGCRSDGRITSTSPTEATGGGIISDIFTSADVTVSGCVNNSTINCYGDELLPAGLTGGIVGRVSDGTGRLVIKECINNGKLATSLSGSYLSHSYAGGIAAFTEATGNFSIIDCKNTAPVSTTVLSGDDTRSVSGGIVGYSYKTIEIKGCVNTGAVTVRSSAPDYTDYAVAGGIAGLVFPTGPSSMIDCMNSAPVTLSPTPTTVSYSGAGGAAGFVSSTGAGTFTIADTSNSGTISATVTSPAFAGGMVGRVSGKMTIEGCSNTASVEGNAMSGSSYVGGLTGYTGTSTTIESCFNAGQVTSTANTGAYAGGISGSTSGTTDIKKTYNTGTVTGTSSNTVSYIGGIIGYFSTTAAATAASITDCYNTASVSASAVTTASAGGIAGYLNPAIARTIQVTNAYSVGTVSATGATARAGGIAGYSASELSQITNCYFLAGGITINGAAFADWICHAGIVTIDGDRVTPRPDSQWSGEKSSSQMAPTLTDAKNNASIYNTQQTLVVAAMVNGWDFNDIWTIKPGENNGYPILEKVEPEIDVYLTGTVKKGADPLNGVTISYNSTSVTTNASGQYEIVVTIGTTVTITGVTLTGYTVNEVLPISIVMDGDKVQDFTMTPNAGPDPTYSVSGKVTHIGNPLQGVKILYTVSGRAHTAVTDINGNYSISGIPAGSSVRITAVIKTGYSVVEPMPGSFNISSDRVFNFTMLPHPVFILSGTVTNGTDPLSNVTITYNGGFTATDDEGKYYISSEGGTNRTILEVTLSGYTVNEALPVTFAMTQDRVQDFTMKADEVKQDMLFYYILALILLFTVLLIILLWFFRRSYEVVRSDSSSIIGDDRARRKKEYVFTVEGEQPGQAVYRVGEDKEWRSLEPDENGKYIIPKEEVVGKLTIDLQ